jgi:hypothetical protein
MAHFAAASLGQPGVTAGFDAGPIGEARQLPRLINMSPLLIIEVAPQVAATGYSL